MQGESMSSTKGGANKTLTMPMFSLQRSYSPSEVWVISMLQAIMEILYILVVG